MQPFSVPRTTIPVRKGPVPGPAGRIPGPQPGARPGGVPTFPNQPGPKTTMPLIGNVTSPQIPPTNITEEQIPPKENIPKETVKPQPPEQKVEAVKTEQPTKVERGPPPQVEHKPQPKAMPKAEPHPQKEERQPPMIAKKPEFEQKTQYRGFDTKETESRENTGEQTSEQLYKLSESLQAMKSLRDKFKGFNVDPEDNEEEGEDQGEQEEEEGEGDEEQQQEEEEYDEGEGEDDDYVRVEDGEDRGEEENDNENENENEQEIEDTRQVEAEENQRQIFQGQQQYHSQPQEERRISENKSPALPQEKLLPPKEQSLPVPKPEERNLPPPRGNPPIPMMIPQGGTIQPKVAQIKRQSFKQEPETHSQQPPRNEPTHQQQETEVSRPEVRHMASPEKTFKAEPLQAKSQAQTEAVQHSVNRESHEKILKEVEKEKSVRRDSDYDKIVKSETESRVDPNVILRLEKLELELEKERKKVAYLETEQERLIRENLTLKQQNSELTARNNLLSRKAEQERPSTTHEIDALKEELSRSLEECRQISNETNRVIMETSQYREETDSIIGSLDEEKNRLYQQVLDLRRQIDEEYVSQIERFRQKTDLLEQNIREYEANFQLVQNQLKEKTETLHRITSLNSEIQSALSSIPQTLVQAQAIETQALQSIKPPATTTTNERKSTQASKPETKVTPPAKSETKAAPPSKPETKVVPKADVPRSHQDLAHQKEERKVAPEPKHKSSFDARETQQRPAQITHQTQPEEHTKKEQETHEKPPKEESNERPPLTSAFGAAHAGGHEEANEKPPLPGAGNTGARVPPSTSTVSKDALMAPPSHRIPNKGKEPPKKPQVGFKAVPAQLFAETPNQDLNIAATEETTHHEQPETSNKQQEESRQDYQEPRMDTASQPPVHHVAHSKPKIAKMDKPMFQEEVDNNFLSSFQTEPQPENTYEYDQYQQQYEQYGVQHDEQQYEQQYYQQEVTPEYEGGYYQAEERYDFQETYPPQQEKTQPSNLSSNKQSKSNLRYSQANVAVEKDPGTISAEAAENFFDQLGSNQSQSYEPQQVYQSYEIQTHSHPQTHATAKPKGHSPVKRGKNPFADETPEEASHSQSTDFFQTSSHEGFGGRTEPPKQNPTRPVTQPIQTTMPKKAEELKGQGQGQGQGQVSKGSALKKMKGNIPSSMFE